MSKYIPKLIGFLINATSRILPRLAARWAIVLFSSPRKGRLNPESKQYLNAAKAPDLLCENVRIASYHWLGEKDTVLLVHGWESNSARWASLLAILQAQRYNVVAFDAPAHGASGGRLFDAVFYSKCILLAVKKYKVNIIVGHSIGGMAALMAAQNEIFSLKKIVFLGAPSNFSGILNEYAKIMNYNKLVVQKMNQYCLDNYGHLPSHFCVENLLPKSPLQALIVHDKRDRIIPYADALEIKKHYQNATLISTEGLGHSLKSEVVYRAVMTFLKS